MTVPYRKGALLLLLAHRGGQAVPDLLPQGRVAWTRPSRSRSTSTQLAEGQKFMALGAYAVSDDGNLLAYSTDNTGFRQYTLYVKDLRDRRGRCRDGRGEGRLRGLGRRQPDALLHRRGRSDEAPVPALPARARQRGAHDLVYEEKDERFNVGVGRTRSRALPGPGHRQPHHVRGALPAPPTSPTGEWQLVAPRIAEQEYDVDHHGDCLLHPHQRHGPQLPPGDGAGGRARAARTGRRSCPHRPDVMLEGIDFFQSHYVLLEREDGLPQLRVVDLADRRVAPHRLSRSRPTPRSPAPTPSSTPRTFRYTYQSLVTPRSVFDYDLEHADARRCSRSRPRCWAATTRAQYESERAVRHRDGRRAGPDLARVPEGARRGTARRRMLLYGYGSYGFALPGRRSRRTG